MNCRFALCLIASLVACAMTVPVLAQTTGGEASAQDQTSVRQQIASASSEELSRMLIARKIQRAALVARNATTSELAQVETEMGEISSKLRVQLSEPAPEVNDAQQAAAVFPRIVPPAPPPAPSVTTAPYIPSSESATGATAAFSPFVSLETPEDLAARSRLEQVVSLTVEQQSLERVLAFLQETTRVPIRVEWKVLAAAGIDRNTAVTADLRNMPARRVFARLCAELSDHATLGLIVEDGGVTLSTRDDLNSTRYQVVRVIDIRDLVAPGDYPGLPPEALFQVRQNRVTNLTDLIKSVVAPDSWRDNGGTIGSIRELDGLLVVTQSKDNLYTVEQLLAQLRSRR